MKLDVGPLLDARGVEVVPIVAWKRCHIVTRSEVLQADAALEMLIKVCAVQDSRKLAQSHAYCTAIALLRGYLLLATLRSYHHCIVSVVWFGSIATASTLAKDA